MSKENEYIVEMKNITKRFAHVVANQNINFSVKKGEVHALLGENGAGKTTLMNQLYGLYEPSEGEIIIKGKKLNVTSPSVAISEGIGMVHQHFMLIKPFTVTQNIILGEEPTKFKGILDLKKAREHVLELSGKFGFKVDPDAKISDISVGMQQRVEILKILYRGADILIFDEPTAVLTPQEIDEFIKIIHRFTENGKTIIIITHKLKEILAMADVCTIIRRGKTIDTVDVSKTTEKELAEKMVGRDITFKVNKKPKEYGETVLEINNLVVRDERNLNVIDNLSLDVRAGEILGIAGVDGNGQAELVESLMGLREVQAGSIFLKNEEMTGININKSINFKVGCIPADRQKEGLSPNFSIAENLIIKEYKNQPFSKSGILNFEHITNNANKLISEFDVRTPSEMQMVNKLSGGNQQKVIIAREISLNPDLLIAVQPTRGLDVGAIEFIHRSIIDERNVGKGVLLISFELDEILDLSDRIAVMYEGKIVSVLDANKTDSNEVGLLMAGGKN